MAMKKPRISKLTQDGIVNGLHNSINKLYGTAISCIPFEASDDQLLEAMVHEKDILIVRRSSELYKYLDDDLYNTGRINVWNFPNTQKGLCIKFDSALSWVPPNYLIGSVNVDTLPASFVPMFAPYVEQAMPFYELKSIALEAYSELRTLCADQLNRMLYLWPALEMLTNYDLSLLPKPIGSPSLTPDLRRKLETATTFINTVKLMPEHKGNTSNVSIWLM